MTEYQDMMEFTFGGADLDNRVDGFQSGNIDDTRITGGEISFMGQGDLFGLPTTLLAGYTYINPQYQDFTEQVRMNSTSDENVLKYRFYLLEHLCSTIAKWKLWIFIFMT